MASSLNYYALFAASSSFSNQSPIIFGKRNTFLALLTLFTLLLLFPKMMGD